MGTVKQRFVEQECAEFMCDKCREALKQLADANAERIQLETMLVDAMATLQFYASGDWRLGEVYRNGEYSHASWEKDGPIGDSGKRARVALRRILDAGAQFARIAEVGE